MKINDKIHNFTKKFKYNIGIYASDLSGNEIKVNEHKTFETASCIKLFILIEYFRQIECGIKKREDIFIYTEEDHINNINSGIITSLGHGLQMTSKDYLILMIILSDNLATNKLIDYLGLDNINNTIKELNFKNTILFNKIDFTKYRGLGSTTPYEYAIAFKKILHKELFNKELSEEMLEILKRQKNNDMLIKGMPLHDILFKGTDESLINYIASKSGAIAWETDEIENVRNDGGIISTIYGDYIVSIFISGFEEMYLHYNNEAINCGSQIHKLIFDEYINNKGRFNVE